VNTKRYISIDLETTGLDHESHEIIQIGAVCADIVLDDSTNQFVVKEVGNFSSLIKPVFTNNISKEAMKVNCLAKQDLDVAPSSHTVRGDFIEWWEEVLGGEKMLVLGQNYGGFDKPFLEKFLQIFYDRMFDYHNIDTWSESELLQRLGIIPEGVKLSLESVTEHFDEVRLSHSALSDAYSAIHLRCKFMNILRDNLK